MSNRIGNPFGFTPGTAVPGRRETVLDPAYQGSGPPAPMAAVEPARAGLMGADQPADTGGKPDFFSNAIKLLAPIIGLMAGGKKGLAYGTQFSTGFIGEQRRQEEERKKDEQRRADEADRKKRMGLAEDEGARAAERAAREKEKFGLEKEEIDRKKIMQRIEVAEQALDFEKVEEIGVKELGVSGMGSAALDRYTDKEKQHLAALDLQKAQAQNYREPNRNPLRPIQDRLRNVTSEIIDPAGGATKTEKVYRINDDGTMSEITVRPAVRQGLEVPPPPPPPPPPAVGIPADTSTVAKPSWATPEVLERLKVKEKTGLDPNEVAYMKHEAANYPGMTEKKVKVLVDAVKASNPTATDAQAIQWVLRELEKTRSR